MAPHQAIKAKAKSQNAKKAEGKTQTTEGRRPKEEPPLNVK